MLPRMTIEPVDLDGTGPRPHELYHMPPAGDFWRSVTSYFAEGHGVPCPVEGCENVVIWFEAGYVPGYRVCAQVDEAGVVEPASITHRFVARGTAEDPMLVRER